MLKVWRAVLAAALALSVGMAWAGARVEVDINGTETDPYDFGGDVVYDGGSENRWITSNVAGGVTGYGTLDNLTVIGNSSLTIGTDVEDYPTGGPTVVNLAEGENLGSITIGDDGSFGSLRIGLSSGQTRGVAVNATRLKIANGEVLIGSSSSPTPGEISLLSLTTLDLDNSAADVELVMEGALARLNVSGIAFVGSDGPTDHTALLAVSGETWFGEGIVLGYNGVLANIAAGSTTIVVGSSTDAGYAAGDIFMTGNATIIGGAVGQSDLAILDMSEQQSADGAPLSSLIIQGEGNAIVGNVDVSSLKEMLVDGEVEIPNELAVRDFRQVSGAVESFGDGVLVVDGTTAKVTGGSFNSDVLFTNAELKSFDFEGSGLKGWLGETAILDGGNNVITGVAGAGQTVNIGKYAGMVIGEDGEFIDINVNVAKEGTIDVFLDADDSAVISSTDASAPVAFVVESANSFKFTYENIYENGIGGVYDSVDADNPLLLVVAGDNASLDIPEFSFDGMFGYFKFASSGEGSDFNGYGLVDYEDNGVDFDGSRADADAAHATLRPAYGDAVNRGLADMAYRMGMYVATDGSFDPTVELPPLVPSALDPLAPDLDSSIINSLNLLDIAAGRADMSIVSLYNGSNVFGVNQVAVSTALGHAQIGMRRSDEIRRLNAMLGDRLSGSAAYASDIMNQCYVNRFWAGGFGLLENAGSYRGFAGYKYQSAGVAVGYDRMFGPNLIVGGSFAATLGEYEDKSALAHDSDIDSYSFNLYATYTHHSGFFASLFGGYAYSDNGIRELRLHNLTDLAWNAADYHTKSWTIGGKLGYDLKPVERFTITPSVGLTWIDARSSAHDEYFDDVAVARFSRMKTNQTYLPVELGFGYDALVGETSKLTLSLNLGYAYNFNNDQIKGTIWQLGFLNDTPYAAVSREPGHHTYTVGGGLRYTVGRFDIGAKYDYARKSKMDSHRLYGTIGISF